MSAYSNLRAFFFCADLRYSLTKVPGQTECLKLNDVECQIPNDESKCRDHDCGILCINTYKNMHHNKILGMCVTNYNFCQCLTKNAKAYVKNRMPMVRSRKNDDLEINNGKSCNPTSCTIACLRKDYDFGFCQLDKPLCSCWTSLNYPSGIGLRPSGWFGIVNLEIVVRSLRLVDSDKPDIEFRYIRRRAVINDNVSNGSDISVGFGGDADGNAYNVNNDDEDIASGDYEIYNVDR